MLALVFQEGAQGGLSVQRDRPIPIPGAGEALIRILRAGICSTDLEITRGYVPGFHAVLGHEFVGVVDRCDSRPELQGRRVNYTCADAVFQRNHAPGRVVLGIIGKDGTMAQCCTLPAANLHPVPDSLTDQQACYAEPLAAACRLLEQKVPPPGSRVAVIGDGKLGLLVASVLVAAGGSSVALFGRHAAKMALVAGCAERVVVDEATQAGHAGLFDVVVDASGTSNGIRLALALVRPLGTLVLKSTVSLRDPHMPGWSEIANDIVVNEKVLVGSRCGPMDVALQMMEAHASIRELLEHMTHAVRPLAEAQAAMQEAATKGVLKIQLLCNE